MKYYLLNRLLERPRRSINTEMTDFHWDPMFLDSPDYVQSHVSDIYGARSIFPLHSTLSTRSEYDTDLNFKRIHCKQLHDLTML